MTAGHLISEVKNLLRLSNADAHASDRLIYSLLKKHRAWLVKREDSKLRVLRIPYLMQRLPCEDLVDVDVVECEAVRSGVTIKRTKDKLPAIINGYYGPLIRDVKSIDRGESLQETTSSSFIRKRNLVTSKYDTTLYFWWENGYLYFPNVSWEGILIEAYFEDPLNTPPCMDARDSEFPIPDSLVGEMINYCLQDLRSYIGLPEQEKIDKNENNK